MADFPNHPWAPARRFTPELMELAAISASKIAAETHSR
jgi:hypothetical protein